MSEPTPIIDYQRPTTPTGGTRRFGEDDDALPVAAPEPVAYPVEPPPMPLVQVVVSFVVVPVVIVCVLVAVYGGQVGHG